MSNFTIGIDLGKIQDYSALSITERLVAAREIPFSDGKDIVEDDHYHVRHLHRWELGTDYPQIIREVGAMMRKQPELLDAGLVIDATGVGRSVLALFEVAYQRQLLGHYWPWGMIITGGREVNHKKRLVPKSELVSKMQAVLQTGRFKVGQSRWTPILKDEFGNFTAKINLNGSEVYESARERDHDDLVLAVAMSVWYKHWHGEPRHIELARS